MMAYMVHLLVVGVQARTSDQHLPLSCMSSWVLRVPAVVKLTYL